MCRVCVHFSILQLDQLQTETPPLLAQDSQSIFEWTQRAAPAAGAVAPIDPLPVLDAPPADFQALMQLHPCLFGQALLSIDLQSAFAHGQLIFSYNKRIQILLRVMAGMVHTRLAIATALATDENLTTIQLKRALHNPSIVTQVITNVKDALKRVQGLARYVHQLAEFSLCLLVLSLQHPADFAEVRGHTARIALTCVCSHDHFLWLLTFVLFE